jgi:hypothetical protein
MLLAPFRWDGIHFLIAVFLAILVALPAIIQLALHVALATFTISLLKASDVEGKVLCMRAISNMAGFNLFA